MSKSDSQQTGKSNLPAGATLEKDSVPDVAPTTTTEDLCKLRSERAISEEEFCKRAAIRASIPLKELRGISMGKKRPAVKQEGKATKFGEPKKDERGRDVFQAWRQKWSNGEFTYEERPILRQEMSRRRPIAASASSSGSHQASNSIPGSRHIITSDDDDGTASSVTSMPAQGRHRTRNRTRHSRAYI